LRADIDVVIEYRDLAEIESTHRKTCRRARRVTRQHTDCALCGLSGGSIALLRHRLVIDDLNRGRDFAVYDAEEARHLSDNAGIERRRSGRRRCRGRARRLRRSRPLLRCICRLSSRCSRRLRGRATCSRPLPRWFSRRLGAGRTLASSRCINRNRGEIRRRGPRWCCSRNRRCRRSRRYVRRGRILSARRTESGNQRRGHNRRAEPSRSTQAKRHNPDRKIEHGKRPPLQQRRNVTPTKPTRR
jgi:hypothetical protein